jgi:hypothetical protein
MTNSQASQNPIKSQKQISFNNSQLSSQHNKNLSSDKKLIMNIDDDDLNLDL